MNEKRIKEMIQKEVKKTYKQRPFLKQVKVSFGQSSCGRFYSKLKARGNRQTLHMEKAGHCLENSVKKIFINLKRVLEKKKQIRTKKTIYSPFITGH